MFHYNGETSPGSTLRSERLKPFLSGLRKVCDISIRLRHRTPSNPWVQDVLQWRVFEALLYSVRTDLRLADSAVTIFNACSSSVLKFRCFSCTVLTKLRDKLCNSTIFLRAIRILCALIAFLRGMPLKDFLRAKVQGLAGSRDRFHPPLFTGYGSI